jgi:succinyl-CoA synthetase beta subunit
VKAQIHAGGRGKGGGVGRKGGVRVAKSPTRRRECAADARHDAGHQADRPEGKVVKRLYIEEGCDIARELYLGCSSTAPRRVTFIASTEGGMDIEEVAHETPEKILKVPIDPATGLPPPHQAARSRFALGLDGKQVGAGVKLLTALYKAFVEKDSTPR